MLDGSLNLFAQRFGRGFLKDGHVAVVIDGEDFGRFVGTFAVPPTQIVIDQDSHRLFLHKGHDISYLVS